MATNPYFLKNQANEISLFQSLVTESIQVIGHDVYYLPRKLQKLDLILGEDTLSKFDLAIPIEMYMKRTNWGSDKDLLTKFGLMDDDNVEYTISKPRWTEIVEPYIGQLLVDFRPQEGDLVYDELNKNLHEITYVDRDTPYYQFGTNLFYVLKCKPYVYGQEVINTGITVIDTNSVSYDLFNQQLKQEDGSLIMQENGDSLLQDAPAADSSFDETEAFHPEAVDQGWSKSNPFGE